MRIAFATVWLLVVPPAEAMVNCLVRPLDPNCCPSPCPVDDAQKVTQYGNELAQLVSAIRVLRSATATFQNVGNAFGTELVGGLPLPAGFSPAATIQALQGFDSGISNSLSVSSTSVPALLGSNVPATSDLSNISALGASLGQARRQANQNGLAFAVYAVGDAGQAAHDAVGSLANSQASGDLRRDVQVNSATALAALSVLTKLKLALGVMTEGKSVRRLGIADVRANGGGG